MTETTTIYSSQSATSDGALANTRDGDRPIYDIGLPDEEVSRILDKLNAQEVQVTGTERRSVRHCILGTALIVGMSRPGFATADFRVRLRNISRHGVAFISRYALEPGTLLNIQLPIGRDLEIRQEPGVVVRCREVEDGIYEIGVDYKRGLAAD